MGPGKVLLIMGLLCVLKRCDCTGSPQVKLVNGPDRCSGRVEVYHEGQWGTICHNLWDLNDAQVVCRQVGCGTALTAKRRAFFGEGRGKVWLGYMHCLGHERFLDACSHLGYGVTSCSHALDAGVICSSINECLRDKDICGPNAYCTNLPRSYTCTCESGYTNLHLNSTHNGCIDKDECLEDGDICGVKGTCENHEGSYWCNCSAGYSNYGNERTPCSDKDECLEDGDICGVKGTCENHEGSYWCNCSAGYSNYGNERTPCSDKDECLEDGDICGVKGTCENHEGSYWCNCSAGYSNYGNERTPCSDKDECLEDGDICGVKGTCENHEGSYWCNCSAGYSNYGNERTPCSEVQCDQFKAVSTQSSSGLSHILSLMWNICTDLSEGKPSHGDVLLKMFTAVEDLLESPAHLHNSDNSDNSDKVTGLLQIVDDAVRLIGPQLQDNYTHIETNQTEAELAVRKGKTPPTGPIHLSSHSATLNTDWQTFIWNGTYAGFAFTVLVSYTNLEKSVNHSFQLLRGHQEDGVDPNYQVISKVVSVVVSTKLLDKPVILTMRHLQEEKNTSKVKFICAYWKSGPQGQDGEEGAWATDGCTQQSTNATHTVCRSKHLKGFAVLMALYQLEELFELEVLTMLGLVVSLLCLAVCIFTFSFCRSIKGTRTTIHLHLCICLFVADLIFLAGVSQTESEVGCKLVAALLHYFFLGTFCWMLLEGVLLYRMVQVVFDGTIRHRYMYSVGYGTPLVIVVISAISRPMGYGTERHCWLSLEHGFIWSFLGPVFAIIVLNVFFFIVTVRKLVLDLPRCSGSDTPRQHTPNQDHSNLHDIKKFTLAAIALLCVLGLTWVFGAFLFEDATVTVVYIFTILNSLQGALIFVFHCLLSEKVRREWYIICTRKRNHPSSRSQESRSPTTTRESIPLAQR